MECYYLLWEKYNKNYKDLYLDKENWFLHYVIISMTNKPIFPSSSHYYNIQMFEFDVDSHYCNSFVIELAFQDLF